ncbi:MAG: T9SS type A sorting domain-containing protein [Saprospiraceae bacterium]
MKHFYLKCLAVLALVTTISFTANAQCTGLTAPFTETFDATTLPTCWTQSATSGGPWSANPGFFNDVQCTVATDHTGNNGSFVAVDMSGSDAGVVLETDDINISTLTTPYLEFYYWMCNGTYSPANELYVEAWDGTTWNSVGSILTYTNGWEEFGYDLSTHVYNVNFVKLRFRAESGGSGSDFYGDHGLDDVSVKEAPTCFKPTALTVTNVTSSGADFGWTDGNMASSWEIEYGAPGYTQGTGTASVVSSNPTTITTMSPASSYDLYVRAICGVADSSEWEGPINVTTGCVTVLSGTYTIGGVGADYADVAAAVVNLNTCGVSGPVTFNIAAGTYTGELAISSFTGGSATNTVTFNGAGAATTTITYDGSNTQNATIQLDGADYVTFQNLTIENTESSSYGWGVHLTNGADYNTIDNCVIDIDDVSTATSFAGVMTSNSNTSTSGYDNNANYTTISNTTINGGYYSVRFNGLSATYNVGNEITNCILTNSRFYHVYNIYQENPVASGNTCTWRAGVTSGYGIFMNNSLHAVTSGNTITGAYSYGIYYVSVNLSSKNPTQRAVISNNMISALNIGDGIYLSGSDSVDVYYNTATAVNDHALHITSSSDGYDVRNNIFVTSGTSPEVIDLDADPTSPELLDNNIYYHSGGGNIAIMPAGTYSTLAAWKGADAAQNVSSLEGDPGFLSTTDLHLVGILANDVAAPIASVTMDIDGDMRSATTPDIGADEYTPPSCSPPTALTVTNLLSTSADLGWTLGNTETMWDVEYGTVGFTAGTGTMDTTSFNPYSVTMLTPNTAYEFYVRANCGSSTSPWIGPFAFTTSCSPFSVFPYTQDFDLLTPNNGSIFSCITTDNTGDCWSNGAGQSNNWTARSSATGSSGTGPSADHTGSGNYVFLEGSSCSGNTSDLYSATFDFTALSAPTLSFWYHMYGSNMGTLEVSYSMDGGTTWSAPIWSLSGDQGNMWHEAKMLVPALGGQSSAMFRFSGTTGSGFATDMAIDDVTVDEAPADDVAVTDIMVGTCTSTESVTVEITNFGANTQTSIPVSMSINGAAAVMEIWTGSLTPGMSAQHTFAATFDATTPGTYNINAAAQLMGDLVTMNDSRLSTIDVTPILASPHGENFEGSSSLPQGWTTDGGLTTFHNAGSRVVFRNMWPTGSQSFTTTTPKFTISAGDYMSFDYRYVDFSAGTAGTALVEDSLLVQISTDCGVTFTTVDVIDSSNHVASASYARLNYDMSAYAGQTILARVHATYGGAITGADYFLDLDNFFVGVPLAQSSTATAELCAGANNGTGTITATAGLAPYTYSWSNGETAMMAMNLPAGMNYYTVTDAAGTMIMDSVSVMAGTAVTAAIAMDAMVSCNGAMDAGVTASMTNGTAPYAYSWTNGATTAALTNVGAGAYTAVVTDANGCVAVETVVVTEPMAMSAMSSAMDITCNGAADGTGEVMVSGGTGSYTYAWSNAETTAALTGLSAGTYYVTATDANNCMTMDSVMVSEPMVITVTAATDANVDCNGDFSGGVSVTATGGTGMLSYAWSNGSALASLTGIGAGTYSVTVTDENGCPITVSADVTEPDALTLSITTTSDSVALQLGEAVATVAGGTAPYTYTWSDGQTTATATGLVEGLYTVTITDANGCGIDGFVSVADVVSTNGIDYVSDLSIYPNPTNYNTTINLELSQNADIAVSIFTITGVLVQDFGKENTSQVNHQVDVSNYAEGMYLVRFVIDNQIITKKLLVTK